MKIWKKAIVLLAALVLSAGVLGGCKADKPPEGEKEPPLVTVERPTEEETRAKAMVKAIFDNYAVSGGSGENEYINVKEYHNTTQSGFLWSNFSAAGMQYYMCKLYPEDNEQKETFRKMINNFKYFRQSNPAANSAADSVKYHSGRGSEGNGGHGDCFFDDNIWVARNFLRAYELFGDEWYLEEAKRVNNWVLWGWNDDLKGIVWSEVGLTDGATEQHLERGLSANACGIMVNAMLSELAENAEEKAYYFEWAEKFYDFCKIMQNKPESYDYWNGIHTVIENGVRKNGGVNRVHYAYNSGSMILADLLMYDLETDQTKKAEYMDDAVGTSAAAKKTFNLLDPGASKFYYTGDPWFACILNEAYYELRLYKPEEARKYMESFNKNATAAYLNRDPVTKLFPYQATKKFTWEQNASWVIHQVGVAEQAVLCALYSIE